MSSFVSWQDDSSAESDDEEEGVSQRLQAQFVTFIDCVLCFLSLNLCFTNGREEEEEGLSYKVTVLSTLSIGRTRLSCNPHS